MNVERLQTPGTRSSDSAEFALLSNRTDNFIGTAIWQLSEVYKLAFRRAKFNSPGIILTFLVSLNSTLTPQLHSVVFYSYYQLYLLITLYISNLFPTCISSKLATPLRLRVASCKILIHIILLYSKPRINIVFIKEATFLLLYYYRITLSSPVR